jgi:diguanylate cyclase (GGDEF)-like protein/PAS domain S-box-containing protein
MRISNAKLDYASYDDSGIIEHLNARLRAKRSLVLIAGEHSEVHDQLHAQLSAEHEVLMAADSRQALDMARGYQPDLVLFTTDLNQEGSFALVDALRADAELAPSAVILISHQPVEHARAKCLQAGADDYLSYPFDSQEFSARIHGMMALGRARREARELQRCLRKEAEELNRLQALSSRLLAAPTLEAALEDVLNTAITALGTQMGSIQLYRDNALHLFAHRGFKQDYLDYFHKINEYHGTVCGKAVELRKRILVENIQADPEYKPYWPMAINSGFFGVQVTPLINGEGRLLGLLSAYFDHPHIPTGNELRLLDFYSRKAINIIERISVEEALRASESKFRTLAEASPALIWQVDAHGNIIYINERYQTLLGIAAEDMLSSNWHHHLHDENLAQDISYIAQVQHEQKPIHRRFNTHDKSGNLVVLDTHALPWFEDNKFAGYVGISIDITTSIQAQHELFISNERLKLAIEGAGDGVWDWDLQNGEFNGSWRFQEILGFAYGEMSNQYDDWQKRIHPEDIARVQSVLEACLKNTVPFYVCEHRIKSKNGEWKWLLSRGIVVERDNHSVPLRMTGTISDISEKRRVDEAIWQHANYDSLTGLPNRRLFRDRLNQEIKKSERIDQPLALFFIDLDQFKEVNDLLGHDVGDLLLADAARRISGCVRQSDTVARLGGDEFTAIVPELDDTAHVEQLAQTIIASLAEPFHLGDETIYLSASLGITLYPTDADTAEKLITNADQAMYAAKNAGRNQFSYFTQSMQERAHARMRLISDLRNALAQEQLEVHYQPIVDLQTGKIIKAEALLRWQHPQLGVVDPRVFIPLAEESGLIHEIGFWTFEQAVLCSKKWSEELGQPFQISVNKSPVQLLAPVRKVNWAEHLEIMGLSGSHIAIEITESVLLNASSNVINKLMKYRQAGIQMSIDDFGTGYSSMAYLKKFAIDYLKIDQSFIRDMTDNPGDLTIVKSVIVMAHELGIQVIAEGIETEEQKQLLIESSCDYAQGFLFSEPMPADRFEQMLLANDVFSCPQSMFSPNTSKLIS